MVYQLTPVYLPEPPAGVAAVSERPRCGPIGPSGYPSGGFDILRHLLLLTHGVAWPWGLKWHCN